MNIAIDRLKPAYLLLQENPQEKELTCVKNTLVPRPGEIQNHETISQP